MCSIWAFPAMTAVSGIADSIGGYYDAKAKNKSLEFNAEASEANAANAIMKASFARQQAQRNANEQRKETGLLLGAQRAKMGASGAVVNSGSFLDVSLSTVEEGEKDAMAILQDGDMQAWSHEVEAGQYDQQARLYRASKVNPTSVLVGGLLSTAAQSGLSYWGASQFAGPSGSVDALSQPGYGEVVDPNSSWFGGMDFGTAMRFGG